MGFKMNSPRPKMNSVLVPLEYLRPLSKQDQITELNNECRCTLRPSPIQGIGVFALRNIQKGQRCYLTPAIIPRFYNISFASLSGLLPEIKELVLQRWAGVVNGSIFQSPNDDQSLLMFVNHAYYPNCNYDVVSDTALRDIREGEEITEDYTMMENYDKIYTWLNSKKDTKDTG